MKHVRTHASRNFECEVCQKTFTQRALLMTHIKTHIAERAYKCRICYKEFKTSGNRWTHEKIHGDRKHKCHLCTAAFHQAQTLRNHIKRHERDELLSCLFYSYTATLKGRFFKHSRTHLVEHPYFCESCGMEFRTPAKHARHATKCNSNGKND